MKIAIIGGGIFGVQIANKLSKNHYVEIFEKNEDILNSASGINQYRLHRGYHYPRSNETVKSSMYSENKFRKEFESAIIDNFEHYYCIAKENSFTNSEQYTKFCKLNNLEFKKSNLDLVNEKKIELCVNVKESIFDSKILKKICWKKLKENRVKVNLNTNVLLSDVQDFDYIIIATYSELNQLLDEFPKFQKDLQFELCEKPVIQPPTSLKNKSIVVMDGPFMCIDPFGHTGNSVLGNVIHAIHESNVGKFPNYNELFIPLLNNGIIHQPSITNFSKFIASASEFIPDIKKSKHVGSMFTIRTVLPNLEKTDARPTVVTKISNNIITVFSGKIVNSIEAAEKVEEIIDKN